MSQATPAEIRAVVVRALTIYGAIDYDLMCKHCVETIPNYEGGCGDVLSDLEAEGVIVLKYGRYEMAPTPTPVQATPPAPHIHAAQMFNRVRDTLTTPEQHDALDAAVSAFADTLTDPAIQSEFMDHAIMGEPDPSPEEPMSRQASTDLYNSLLEDRSDPTMVRTPRTWY